MNSSDQKQRLRRNIRLAYLYVFLSSFSFAAPISTLLIGKITGSVLQVAQIFVIMTISSALLEVPAGIFADLFNRRITLIFAETLHVAAMVILAFSQDFSHLIIFAIVSAAANALRSGTVESLVYDTVKQVGDEPSYKRIIGRLYTLNSTALGIASLLGGLLAASSLVTPVWWTIPVFIAAIIVTILFTEPASADEHTKPNPFKHTHQAWRIISRNQQLLIISVITVLLSSFGQPIFQTSQLFYQAKDIPVAFFGILFFLVFAFTSAGSLLADRIAARLGDKYTLLGATMLSAIAIVTATAVGGYFAGLLLAVASFGHGLRMPVMSHLINRDSSSSHRTTILSLNNLAGSLGFAFCALILGYVSDIRGIVFGIALLGILHFAIAALQLKLREQKIA